VTLRFELDPPRQSGPCECCGGTTTTLTRFVYKDGGAYAVYYAGFSDNHAERLVKAALSIGEWGEGSSVAQRTAFALELRAGPENYEVHVCDAASSPWRDSALLGPMLDREAALAHPLVDEVFHITDHMFLEDEPLKAYLDAASG
jgi:hypothetical protein